MAKRPLEKRPRGKTIHWKELFEGRHPNEIAAMIDGMKISPSRKAHLKRIYIRGGEKMTDEQIAAKSRVVVKSDDWKTKHKLSMIKQRKENAKRRLKEGRAEVRKLGKKKALALILDNSTDAPYRKFLCMYSSPAIPYKEVSTYNRRLEYRIKLLIKKGVTMIGIKRMVDAAMKEEKKSVENVDDNTEKLNKTIRELKKRVKELEKQLEESQAEVTALKDKYEPEKKDDKWEWDEKTVTYMECFDRVCAYMDKNTGFVPDIYYNGDDELDEDTEVDIMVYDGEYGDEEHETWDSVRSFVGGDEEHKSIFERLAELKHKYFKLASRWLAGFADSCKSLGYVKVKDRTPVGIMKALDEAGI